VRRRLHCSECEESKNSEERVVEDNYSSVGADAGYDSESLTAFEPEQRCGSANSRSLDGMNSGIISMKTQLFLT